jgi:hypothetical protein
MRDLVPAVDAFARGAALPPAPIVVPPLPRPDLTLPEIVVALPDGEQGRLPGVLWPQVAIEQANQRGRRGGGPRKPLVGFYEVDIRRADELLEAWRHPLGGAASRPFGRMAFVLEHRGDPVAVAVSASTVSASVDKAHGLTRRNTVELARLGRGDREATLPAIRLWASYLAHLWSDRYPSWEPLRAAVSYSLPGTPSSAPAGHGVYRRAGFRKLRDCKPWAGGGTWSKGSRANDVADGVKGLWVWPFEELS